MILNGSTEYTDKWMNPQCFCYNCFVTQNIVQEIFKVNDLVQFCYPPLPFFSLRKYLSATLKTEWARSGQLGKEMNSTELSTLSSCV